MMNTVMVNTSVILACASDITKAAEVNSDNSGLLYTLCEWIASGLTGVFGLASLIGLIVLLGFSIKVRKEYFGNRNLDVSILDKSSEDLRFMIDDSEDQSKTSIKTEGNRITGVEINEYCQFAFYYISPFTTLVIQAVNVLVKQGFTVKRIYNNTYICKRRDVTIKFESKAGFVTSLEMSRPGAAKAAPDVSPVKYPDVEIEKNASVKAEA